ncbi:MAG: hypothetical protein NY202_01760 [Mollicutes bacterium UO1]
MIPTNTKGKKISSCAEKWFWELDKFLTSVLKKVSKEDDQFCHRYEKKGERLAVVHTNLK